MGYDEWELKASPIKISELKPKNNLKHDTSSRVLHSPMAATVWFASPGVFALGVAPACPKRTGFRAPALPRRRVVRVQSKSGGKKDVSAGEGFGDADDWIANWKAGKFPRARGWKFGDASEEGTGTFSEQVTGDGDEVDGRDEEISEETKENPADRYGGDPNAFTYVFCHNLLSPPKDSFACMYLSDTLGALGIELVTPSLIADEGDKSGDGEFDSSKEKKSELTVSAAVARLTTAIDSLPEPHKPVRLIGSGMGAYVCAVYASYPENAAKIDRVMLLAPTFKPIECLAGIETETGVSLGDAFKLDLEKHEPFPFVPCRAYVVHGYDDPVSPLENSLTWVRDASVNMRNGAAGETGQVAERRLLEVKGMGHGVENALPQIKARLVEFFKLPFQVSGPP